MSSYEKVVCERLPLERFLYERFPLDKGALTRSGVGGTGSDSSRRASHGDHCRRVTFVCKEYVNCYDVLFWKCFNVCVVAAIATVRDAPPGTFVVRDSNSFPGAFGLALKVAVPPATVAQKAAYFSGDASELVRHFLIEPTSRGVRLKGCTNEPVFSKYASRLAIKRVF